MITTADADLARRLRQLRQHGMTVSDLARHRGGPAAAEAYGELGFNFRLTDIQAAIGRTQLRRLPDILANQRRLAERYDAALGKLPGVKLPRDPSWARSNRQSYYFPLPSGWEQRAVMEFLSAEGIASKRGIMCAHREPAYTAFPWRCWSGCVNGSGKPCTHLSRSEEAQDRGILLPLFAELSQVSQDRVIEALRRFSEKQS